MSQAMHFSNEAKQWEVEVNKLSICCRRRVLLHMQKPFKGKPHKKSALNCCRVQLVESEWRLQMC